MVIAYTMEIAERAMCRLADISPRLHRSEQTHTGRNTFQLHASG